jgi:hypothetical protein
VAVQISSANNNNKKLASQEFCIRQRNNREIKTFSEEEKVKGVASKPTLKEWLTEVS